MHPPRITLRETSSEYLLFIHASQRERAKRIRPREWDSERGCWVYPHQLPIYEAIVREFGEELYDLTAEPQTKGREVQETSVSNETTRNLGIDAGARVELKLDQAGVAPLQQLFDELNSNYRRVQLELEQATDSSNTLAERLAVAQEQVQQLREQLLAKLNEPSLDVVLRNLEESERLRVEEQSRAEELQRRITDLERERNANLTEVERLNGLIRTSAPSSKAGKYFIGLAQIAADGDEQFGRVLQGQRFDAQLALTLHAELANTVANLLPNKDTTKSLHDLLAQARVQQLLGEDQLELAHLIRRQRNVIAHNRLDRNDTTARIMLALFAAALLWPGFARKEVE